MYTIEEYPFPKSELLFIMEQQARKHGVKFIYKMFREHEKRPYSRALIEQYAPTGIGLEIGCGRQTIAPGTRTILSDGFKTHGKNKSLAKVFFKADEIPYPDHSLQFILSEHVLEHIVNPIKILKHFKQKLASQGVLFLFLPHKERTFDKNRPRTPLTRLIEIYEQNLTTQQVGEQLLNEWKTEVILPGLAPHYNHLSEDDWINKGNMHFNVWLPEDIIELLEYCNFKVLKSIDFVTDRPDSFLIIGTHE